MIGGNYPSNLNRHTATWNKINPMPNKIPIWGKTWAKLAFSAISL
jgi:hypothetical protein